MYHLLLTTARALAVEGGRGLGEEEGELIPEILKSVGGIDKCQFYHS